MELMAYKSFVEPNLSRFICSTLKGERKIRQIKEEEKKGEVRLANSRRHVCSKHEVEALISHLAVGEVNWNCKDKVTIEAMEV